MVKILELGEAREKEYKAARCPACNTKVGFELKDIWFEKGGARITCPNPSCGLKIFLNMEPLSVRVEQITEEEYNNAHGDMSKSGLRMLMEEKELENDRDECYASFYNGKEAITNEDNN